MQGPRDEEAECSTGLSNDSTPKLNSPTPWFKKDPKSAKNADVDLTKIVFSENGSLTEQMNMRLWSPR
eukprot:768593-Hanusia_phi.AAC.6